MIIKQKLFYFGHIARSNGLEKAIKLRMGDGKGGRRRQRRWLDDDVSQA